LKSLSSLEAVVGMSKFGINSKNTYGISIPKLREIARDIGKNHQLALKLWESSIHESRILASFIDEPEKVTENQLEKWVRDFDSWDVCDQCCSNLFDKTPSAYQKAVEWTRRKEEFVKRAGFVLMAALSVHDKKAEDRVFQEFFPIITREATDDRPYVRKAVNWALRQIGKRNPALNREAIRVAGEIRPIDSRAARWIASDALRQLTGEKVQERLNKKKG